MNGESYLDVLRRQGSVLPAYCGGRGACGHCRLRILPAPPALPEEEEYFTAAELAEGWRLACRHAFSENTTLQLPAEEAEGAELLPPDSLRLPELPAAEPGLGLALDLGSTMVAAAVLDLAGGRLLALARCPNRQRDYGADLMSRLSYCQQEETGAAHLAALAKASLREAAELALSACGGRLADVRRATLAGNTLMAHLLLGADLHGLMQAPFLPAYSGWQRLAPEEGLGLSCPLELLPHIAGFVGGDLLAGVLLARQEKCSGWRLLLDAGTNGELALFNEHELYCCSTAAGPAFEGMDIRCGMRARAGALCRVWAEDGRLAGEVLGGGPARGVCGSGLISAAAAGRQLGLILPSGRFSRAVSGNRLSLTEDVFLTQQDLRKLQLAKAAVAAGTKLLLVEVGLESSRLSELLLAGAFGSGLAPQAAVEIGLLPDLPAERCRFLGNSALAGACLCLCRPELAAEAAALAAGARHLSLEEHPDFAESFVQALPLQPLSF